MDFASRHDGYVSLERGQSNRHGRCDHTRLYCYGRCSRRCCRCCSRRANMCHLLFRYHNATSNMRMSAMRECQLHDLLCGCSCRMLRTEAPRQRRARASQGGSAEVCSVAVRDSFNRCAHSFVAPQTPPTEVLTLRKSTFMFHFPLLGGASPSGSPCR